MINPGVHVLKVTLEVLRWFWASVVYGATVLVFRGLRTRF